MDLTFTLDEQTFREDIRDWVKASLPQDISHKVHNALRLSRDDMQRWAKILGKRSGAVARQHWHHRLREDGAVVKLDGDLMHGGAGKLTTCIDGALMRVKPRKSWQQ